MSVSAPGREVYLRPGEVWFGGGSTRVRTILGSCVAITLWHPVRRIGGMCHFMLPHRPGGTGRQHDGRYADEAMHLLMQEMATHGCRPTDFEAKLFGGGRMFSDTVWRGMAAGSGVQERNVTVAHELVACHGFSVKAEHLGGHGHRHVLFDLASGNAWLKHSALQFPASGSVLAKTA